MAIFLRHSYNVKPPRWGNPGDVQYAIKVNAEKIYGIDPDSMVLAMPLFWGLPCLDYSGNNNHGTNHGATYKDGSLDFDGDDYVEVNNNIIDSISAYSVAIWAKSAGAINTYNMPAGSNDADCHLWYLDHRQSTDSWRYTYWDSASTLHPIYSDATVIENKWYFLGAVNTGTNQYLYIDGQRQSTVGSDSGFNKSILKTYIGSWGTYPFTGFIDEVRISNVARTAEQIVLQYELPWALYQPVQRVIYSIPAPPVGAIMNQFQGVNLGADLFNGTLL